MPARIQLLDSQTINQIAAGEVVENPASVVKELIENAIDAKASQIVIEIKGGGRSLVKVVDNGCGMNSEDALLCLERHATSKLRKVDEIDQIQTMGFRGEALASIAAVSKLTLITATEEDPAFIVKVEGGRIIHSGICVRARGTTIEVENLFYNTPARRAFQKSPASDSSAVYKVVLALSLAHPSISFQLINDQQMALNAPAVLQTDLINALKNRMQEVLGADFINSMIPVDAQSDSFSLQGWISTPEATRPNRSGQYLFINNRFVNCPIISYGVIEGYSTLLSKGRYPLFTLHLQMKSGFVDINVHPQKKEVRLRKEGFVKSQIVKAIGHAFQQPSTCLPWEEPQKWSTDIPDISYPSSLNMTPLKWSFVNVDKDEVKTQSWLDFVPSYEVIGLFPPYILLDNKAMQVKTKPGLVFIDTQRAYLHLYYHRFLKAHLGQPIASQLLLIPYTFSAAPHEIQKLYSLKSDLSVMGFSVQLLGHQSLVVESAPAVMIQASIENLFHDFLQGLEKEAYKRPAKEKMALVAASVAASHRSLLTLQEAQLLLNQLIEEHREIPQFCPYGKSLFKTLSITQIQELFQGS